MAVAAPVRVASPAAVRAARIIAWSIWVVGLGLRIAQLVLAARITEEGVRLAWGVGLLTVACATVFGLAQATVGVLIVGRRPRNVIGWLLVASGFAQGLLGAATSWSSIAIGEGLRGPAILVGTVASIGIQAVPLFVVTLVLLIFPDGRLASRRWGWVLVVAVVGLVLRSAEVTWGPPDVFLYPAIRNPYVAPAGLGPLVEAAYGLGLGYRILQVAVTLASVSLWLRYRRADPQTRLQLRWFFWAAAILGVMALPFAYVNIFVPRTEIGTEWTISLLFLGFALPSVAVFVAITRYRLYEIDRIVNRAVLYGSLTAILAGLFTAGIGLAQRVFVLVTHSQSDAAIVLTTFVVATTYAPIRKGSRGSWTAGSSTTGPASAASRTRSPGSSRSSTPRRPPVGCARPPSASSRPSAPP